MTPYRRIRAILQIWAMVVLAAVSLPAYGQTGAITSRSGAEVLAIADPFGSSQISLLKCTSADGSSPCTAEEVAELNREIVESRKQHKPLSEVQDLDLGQHSWLKCSQMDGRACTDEQLSAVIAVAAESQAKRNGLRLVKPVEMAENK